jgi:hypothetical protein
MHEGFVFNVPRVGQIEFPLAFLVTPKASERHIGTYACKCRLTCTNTSLSGPPICTYEWYESLECV